MLRTESASDSFETLLIVLDSTLQVVCIVIMLYTVEVFGRGASDNGNATDSRVLLEAMIAKPMRQLDMVSGGG